MGATDQNDSRLAAVRDAAVSDTTSLGQTPSQAFYDSLKAVVVAQGCWLVLPLSRTSDSWSFVAAVIPPYAVAAGFEIHCDGTPVETKPAMVEPYKQVLARLDLSHECSLSVEFTVHPRDDSAVLSCLTKGGESIGTDYYVPTKRSHSQIEGTSAYRVIRNNDENYYHFTGYDEARKIHDLIQDHCPSLNASQKSVLDWGMGSGRVTQYLQAFPDIDMFGTDIDPVNMSALHSAGLPRSKYRLTESGGDIPFDDESFDAVVGISVFTHLTEELQFYYLAELRRVLRPGGIGIFSVHGLTHFYTQINDGNTLAQLMEGGITIVSGNDDLATGFEASKQLYVDTLHTPDYILRAWKPYFSAISIQQAPLTNMHDLVICRRRDLDA